MSQASVVTRFKVNGKEVQATVPARTTLLRYLRDYLRLTGTKCGCGQGDCGACTVLIDGMPRKSCQVLVERCAGREVTTIEGLGAPGALHPLQVAFIEEGAFQCGFCTPGVIMAAKALLDRNPDPSVEEIKSALQGNLCRCTGYASIVRAVQRAARIIRGESEPVASSRPRGTIGTSAPDKEAEEKVTGRLLFADDIYLDGMLFGQVVLSEYPCAQVLGIDTEEARSVPGVHAVLTAKDVPGPNRFGRMLADQPVLVEDRVRYTGEAVAVVYAETREAAREAASLVRVEYRETEGVYSPLRALEPDAPLVHPQGNLLKRFVNQKGDVGEGFAAADVIVEDTYYTPFVEHAFLEPEAGVAVPEEDGSITIYYPCQVPFASRKQVAQNLGLPEEKVRIISTPMGGAFGGKADVVLEILLALGAWHTRRPVKIALTREESLRMDTKRHAYYMHYKTGATREGKLLAVQARLVADAGAYAGISPGVLEQSVIFAAGPYHWPHVHVEGLAVYTNNIPAGAMRGFGINQVHFALESQLDRLARKLGIDPIELRLQNALDVGLETSTGEKLQSSVAIKETLIRVRAATAQWVEQKRALSRGNKKVGIGFASGYKNIGYGRGYYEHAGALISLEDDGSLLLKVSAVDMGQGTRTVLAQILAEATGVGYDKIKVITGDTSLVPEGIAAIGQRQTYLCGKAVLGAAQDLRRRLLEFVAHRLGRPVGRLAIECGLVKDMAEGAKPVADLALVAQWAKSEGEKLEASYHYVLPPTSPIKSDAEPTYRLYQGDSAVHEEKRGSEVGYRNYAAYSYATQAAMVEVDEETGEVRVLRLMGAHDVGRALNPRNIRGQLEGSLIMGLGYALSEEFRLHKGRVLTNTLRKCGVPAISHLPALEVIVVEDPEPGGPYGAKGMSEAALIPTAAAIANAIYDAVGVRVNCLPLTSGRILDLIRRAKIKTANQGLL